MNRSIVLESDKIRANFPATKLSLSQRKMIFSFGINDADYNTQQRIGDIKLECPAYRAWTSVIRRSNSAVYKARQLTYESVSVCDEWSSFMSFRSWWCKSVVDGWHLDKDLIKIGNKEYSPENCVYVPRWLNNFTTTSLSARGSYPIGVTFRKKNSRYRVRCGNPITGKFENVGEFRHADEAHLAWLERKLSIAFLLKNDMDAIDLRIYQTVVGKIKLSV